jgi:gliding motility-associated-like protein
VRVNLNTVDARFSTSDTTACAPTTVQFNDLSVADSTIVAWGWIFGDGATSFAQNPSHTYTVAGVYTAQLQVTTSTGCIDTASLVITINALPAVAAGPDRTICINDTATLLGTGGVIYQWSPAGSLSDANVVSPQAFPTNTTTYGLTVTDANGCQGTSQVIVNVNPLPVVTTTPSQELCNGDVLQLNATGGVGYLWTPASGLSCNTCPNPIANPFSPTNLVHTYTVQVTDTNGCINTGSTTITRLLLPGITINPDTTICFGNAVEISGGSMQPFTYLWQPSAGLACDTCSTTIASPDSTTTYTLTATGVNGCPRSEEITITVNPLPIAVTSPDTTICHRQTVELTASGGVDYVWTPTQGITCGNACNMVVAAPDSSVTYTVLVTDANGCQSTAEIDVVVHQLEAIFTLSDSSACTPQYITLTDQSSGDNPIVSWLWNLDDGGLANTQNTTVTYSTPGRREIVLLIQDSYGCMDTAMQLVDMLPSPVAIGGPDTTICFGQVAQLQGFGGQIFVWSGDQYISDPNIANPTVKPTTTTDYFLRTEFLNGCTAFDTVKVSVNALPIPAINGDTVACFGDSLRFTATGGSDYVWTPTTYLTTSTLPNTTAYAAQDITYTVLVTDTNGCAAVDSIVLKVNPVPAITVSPNVDICLGESANLEVSGAIDYAWGPNQDISCLDCTNPAATPTESVTYLVVGYNEFGCSTLDTVRVNVRPLPTVQTIADVTLCNSETLELTTSATGATGFIWTANGQPDATIQSPMIAPTISTTYIVEAYNQYGCNDFDTVNVKVIETILAAVSDGAIICEGQNVNLSVDILETGLSGYTITWLPESMFNNPNRLSQTFFPGESMTVQVVINSEGCAADTQSINIVVNSLPTVDLGPNRTVLMGEYVTLNANTTGNIAEYYWSPNDSLDCSDCDNISFNAWGSNTYNVFVTDVNGCTAEDDVSVKVLTTCEQDIFVPNSFSPNNDKSNDVLYVRSHSFEQIKVFRIFDRWGNLVFETSDIEQGWNGIYHNSMVDPGVFVYYLEGTCPNGGDVFLKGNVTVLR